MELIRPNVNREKMNFVQEENEMSTKFSDEKRNDFFDGLEDMFPQDEVIDENENNKNEVNEDENENDSNDEVEEFDGNENEAYSQDIIQDDVIQEQNEINDEDNENENEVDNKIENDSNSNETFTVKADAKDNIDVDAINAALAKAGISGVNVKVTPAKTKKTAKVDKLEYNDEGMAICQFDHNHVFDMNDLDEDMQSQVKKSGLCPNCLSIINQAKAIKGIRINTRVTGGITAGKQIRDMVNFAFNSSNLDDNILTNLMDKDYSRTKMKLAYPMLIEITDKSEDDIKDMRLLGNNKKHYRYSSTRYKFNNRTFLLTNDLYAKNLDKVKDTLTSLNLLEGYVDLTED